MNTEKIDDRHFKKLISTEYMDAWVKGGGSFSAYVKELKLYKEQIEREFPDDIEFSKSMERLIARLS